MKIKLLFIFALFCSLSFAFAGGINNGDIPVAGIYGSNNWGHTSNRPFYRRKYGTLTGVTPPVNYNGVYGYNNGYSSGIYTNNSIGNRIKRFFNQKYNNHYTNSPYYNPNIINGYNNKYIPNNYTPLFNSGLGNPAGQSYSGFDFDGGGSSNTGAAVTIVD